VGAFKLLIKIMCGILLTAFVAGAVEVQPGVMKVQYFPPTVELMSGSTVKSFNIKTDEYRACINSTDT